MRFLAFDNGKREGIIDHAIDHKPKTEPRKLGSVVLVMVFGKISTVGLEIGVVSCDIQHKNESARLSRNTIVYSFYDTPIVLQCGHEIGFVLADLLVSNVSSPVVLFEHFFQFQFGFGSDQFERHRSYLGGKILFFR
jgi:hypothetical protein